MTELSERQGEFLAYINCYTTKYGRAPTYREIALAMNVTSKGTVSAMIDSLVAKGALKRDPGPRGLKAKRHDIVRPTTGRGGNEP